MPAATHTGPVSIIVAVTGHRDLRPDDIPTLRARVREFFQELRTAYPHSDLELLSPLAEGADRLAAQVALDMGLRLTVPLPMEPDEYRKDFTSASSIAEFDALRARAARSFVVKGSDGRAAARPLCYEQVGAYGATHCHLMLALWDGRASRKTGGTSEVVRFRLEGVPPPYAGFPRLLDPPDTGVVHHLVTPRASAPSTSGEPFTLQVLFPDEFGSRDAALDALSRICASTDGFNALAGRAKRDVVARRAQSEDSLFADEHARALSSDARAIRTLFGYADELAIRFQRRTLQTLVSLFWMFFGAVVAFEFFAHGFIPGPVPIAPYVVLLAGAYGLYAWAARHDWDKNYLDYRALAEGLRVQFFWRLARVPASVADHYMRYRLQEVEWIRHALRACELWTATAEPDASLADPTAATLGAVVTGWVESQHRFFLRASHRDQRRLTTIEHLTTALVWMSVIVGVAVTGLVLWLGWDEQTGFEARFPTAHLGLIAALGLLSAAAALISSYAERRALSAHIKRYTHMAVLFQAARKALAGPMATGDWVSAREVLREIGREALEENADWVMLHRERPLEVPQ